MAISVQDSFMNCSTVVLFLFSAPYVKIPLRGATPGKLTYGFFNRVLIHFSITSHAGPCAGRVKTVAIIYTTNFCN